MSKKGSYSVSHRDSGAEGWDVYWSDGKVMPMKENGVPFKNREDAQTFADNLNDGGE